MADYIDELLQAIDSIATHRVDSAGYDKTISCTILNNDDAKEGKYIVSDGSSKFVAHYGDKENVLETGTSVNVLIPKNDYNNEKTILGTVVNGKSSKFNYVSPLEKYFKMEQVFNIDKEFSLLANDDRENRYNVAYNKEYCYRANEIAKEYSLAGRDLKGYTRLAIEGNFKSYIPTAVSGNYGLLLTLVTTTPKESIEISESTKTHYFTFDSNDMWGNPYNFGTEFSQAIVFDISELEDTETISSMTLRFYELGNFMTSVSETLEYKYQDAAGESYLPDNLFVNNIQVSFGYLTDETEAAYLYTKNTMSYAAKSPTMNAKDIKLRWNHIIDSNLKEAVAIVRWEDVEKYITTPNDDSDDEYDVSIQWFHYDAEYKTDDGYGNYWKLIPQSELTNTFAYTLNPDTNKNYEYIRCKITITDKTLINSIEENYNNKIESYDSQIKTYQNQIEVKNAELKNYKQMASDQETHAYDKNITQLEADITNLQQSISDVQSQKNRVALSVASAITTLDSNILTFNNEVQVANESDYNKLNGLHLEAEKNTYNGVYSVYDALTNDLISSYKQYENRTITASFIPMDSENAENISISKIEWKIPKNNTMIQAPLLNVNYKIIEGANGEYYDATSDPDFYIITRYGPALKLVTTTNDNDVEEISCNLNQTFRIKDHLMNTWTNNTIYCTIVKDDYYYSTSLELKFGNSGVNGTNNTLILSFGQNEQAWTQGVTQKITLTAELYDADNEVVTITSGTWKMVWNQGGYTLSGNTLTKSGTTPGGCILSFRAAANTDQYNWVSSYTGYLIVPWRNNASVGMFSGADRVVYDTAGADCTYCKGAYHLNGEKVTSAAAYKNGTKVEKKNSTSTELNYLPYVDVNLCLKPRNLYFSDVDYNIYVVLTNNYGTWYQPILVIQNAWGSSVINSWNGEFMTDEENGVVLGTMLGAGRKDSNNKFEGVLMGDVSKGSGDTAAGIGLYGYKDGVQSFGLLTGGTAFLGKAAKAQIKFDGDKGTIKNAAYDQGTGIKISMDGDTAEAQNISIKNNGNEYVYLGSGTTDTNNTKYLVVKGRSGEELIYIGEKKNGDTKFYIQSSGYDDTNNRVAGTKIDLTSGKMRLKASGGNGYIDINSGASTYPFDINNTFKIKWNGAFKAANNNFKVDEDGNITATGGTIGGWKISDKTLKSGNITLDANSNEINVNNKFVIYNDGTFKASNGNFSVDTAGNITAKGGTIGGWSISSDKLEGGHIKAGTIEGATITGGEIYVQSNLWINGTRVTASRVTFLTGIKHFGITTKPITVVDDVTLNADGTISTSTTTQHIIASASIVATRAIAYLFGSVTTTDDTRASTFT